MDNTKIHPRSCVSLFLCLTVALLSVNSGYAQEVAPIALVLHDATPIRVRLNKTVSSSEMAVNDTVEWVVQEDLKIGNTLIVARGGLAVATVTVAQQKRHLGRGGNLDINIDYVLAVNGDHIALRAERQAKGGGHVGAMVGAMVATSLVFWPAAPFFLLMHGKEARIPRGTELMAYSDGEVTVDPARFTATQVPANVGVSAPSLGMNLIFGSGNTINQNCTNPEHGVVTPQSPITPTSIAPKKAKLTNADVVDLHFTGYSDDIIIAKIQKSVGDYKLETDNLIVLRNLVSPAVIAAMTEASK
jgi:hypothetical protein